VNNLRKTQSGRSGLVFSLLLSLLLVILKCDQIAQSNFEQKQALFFIACIFLIVTFFISMNVFYLVGLFHQFYIREKKRKLPISLLLIGVCIFSIAIALTISYFDNVEREHQVITIFIIISLPLAISTCYQRWKL